MLVKNTSDEDKRYRNLMEIQAEYPEMIEQIFTREEAERLHRVKGG